MIGFFTKKEKNFSNNNSVIKYSKYTIGEIILVMIGILLAVQVNNGNENRKRKLKEIKLLKELRSDLIQNVDDIKANLTFFNIEVILTF